MTKSGVGRLVGALAVAVSWLGGASSAHAELPDGVRYDDGFAWFGAENHREVSNNVPSEAWHLTANARLLGTGIAAGSAFKFVVKKGRRVLGQAVCEGTLTYGYRMHPSNPPNRFSVAWCQDRSQRFEETGEITVEVWFIDDATDEETLVRTHTIDVRGVTRVRGTGQPDAGEFLVNQHAEIGAMLIEQVEWLHYSHFAGINGNSAGSAGWNQTFLHFTRSPSDVRPFQVTMRCSVDGARVEVPNLDLQRWDGPQRTQVVSEIRQVPGTQRTEGDYLKFEGQSFVLPLTFGEGDGVGRDMLNVREHPGRWDCQIRHPDRRVLRTFQFTVGPDGWILPHPEERAGLSLPERVHLLDGAVPADSPIDVRTDPAAARAGAFYGRAWATPEGRAIGAGIPAIGDAYPPSARGARGGGSGGAARGGRRR